MLDRVLDALGTLRSPFAPYEADLHLRVGECLSAAGLPAVHESLLAPGCRIDYLVGGVGVCYRIHPHIELEAEGRCYYALTSTTKDYMKHTKQPQYNTTFTIQAGVKYCF